MKNNIFRSIKKKFDEHPKLKFITIIALIAIYFIFVSQQHGIKDGLIISLLTWSFFVLCTPIADAGILIDFPIKLVTGMKMLYSELIVWTIAITLNLSLIIGNPQIYDKTIILALFYKILTQPFPYWIIIIISAIGTFLSIYIADNLVRLKKKSKKHKSFIIKHKIIIFIFIILIVVTTYNFLLNELGIAIPLI